MKQSKREIRFRMMESEDQESLCGMQEENELVKQNGEGSVRLSRTERWTEKRYKGNGNRKSNYQNL